MMQTAKLVRISDEKVNVLQIFKINDMHLE